ncbi:ABC transporter permease [Alkalinema sp. FACHB-956]|uniref:ABC transporter permease n=1 Tax=Alkalinema sp. FACHB-956 TaxID=2692768 RepID=UPI0016878517|nr:ABC transporter permease [Alkalinema sp. FACHB-956]MBD2329357.1 ABC transporter permease [Alkalinema sp. FACHB-956]
MTTLVLSSLIAPDALDRLIVPLSGALELGLLYGLVAIGVYVSFRVLNFPDLTVDGSFPLGAAVAATLIVKGVNPIAATVVAMLAGAIAGLCTAWLNVQLKILNLLASILTMIALYSINLRIMGQPNVPLLGQTTVMTLLEGGLKQLPSVLSPFGTSLVLLAIVVLVKLGGDRFFRSELGLAMRATGENSDMARAQGIATHHIVLLGMALSNGLVALAGALFAQVNGFADVTLGVGTIVFGLAAVIIGETVVSGTTIFWATLGAIVGSILYRIAVTMALNTDFLGLETQDLNLVTAILVALALVLPQYKRIKWRFR